MKLFRLDGKVQHYAWGGYQYIPALLGIAATDKPSAEYWMGAHTSAPAVITTGNGPVTLDQLIAQDPANLVGPQVWEQFRQLPYLFKILDVKDMLSIQVHPTKAEAEKGFTRENEAGIPLNAPHRNYKDANHKPEIMVALSEFWLLHGFLPHEQLQQVLQTVPEFVSLASIYEQEGYYGLYKNVMEMPQALVNILLRPLTDRMIPAYKAGKLPKSDPGFWAARAVLNDPDSAEKIDRGIFSIYFFNIVQAQPGDAVFQDAGIPHAYLEGQNVELMANSDNVLRGGLTPKHIDVPELLQHTRFEGVHPHIIKGELHADGLERKYPSPAPDFAVSNITLQPGQVYTHTTTAAEILIVMEGDADIIGTEALALHKGQCVFAAYDATYQIKTNNGVMLFKATANN
ncbi:mannose-6-phosphate isomerase, class I [Chitinophaga nivalis]|uniref:mannose-6-phosphate isomerase n=1 Tax=Chitinophaga nivalis TaxID=2991709 RepID=A0ABT3IKV6_9BACT|nr:mannose-6-phosphate isomerase, class I [Chitinophaga nivalis]MCW3465716.1 mannose-6-phosphate isomerase, class I [Chitinophaga nivalis]MCW3484593.1 mannose-6-phosphate isomerase, class I [Chitinophaga nivalis]